MDHSKHQYEEVEVVDDVEDYALVEEVEDCSHYNRLD
jgi:hypothetical protein